MVRSGYRPIPSLEYGVSSRHLRTAGDRSNFGGGGLLHPLLENHGWVEGGNSTDISISVMAEAVHVLEVGGHCHTHSCRS